MRQSMMSPTTGTVAGGRPVSSRYTSFQCSRLTGEYGLGSKGSSRYVAYSGSVDTTSRPLVLAARARSCRWANDGSGRVCSQSAYVGVKSPPVPSNRSLRSMVAGATTTTVSPGPRSVSNCRRWHPTGRSAGTSMVSWSSPWLAGTSTGVPSTIKLASTTRAATSSGPEPATCRGDATRVVDATEARSASSTATTWATVVSSAWWSRPFTS